MERALDSRAVQLPWLAVQHPVLTGLSCLLFKSLNSVPQLLGAFSIQNKSRKAKDNVGAQKTLQSVEFWHAKNFELGPLCLFSF